jgi:hypothetical protein
VEKKFPLKKLNETLRGFVTKRMVKLIFAVVAVMLLSAILFRLTLIKTTSNYQASGVNPSQATPNDQTSSTIFNVGSLKVIGIGAYRDDSSTNRVNGIRWGILEPGVQKSFAIYFLNEGNSAVTLSMSTSNWNPSVASTYLTLSWDYNGQTIKAGENLQVTLTLSVSASITGVTTFNFDIIVVGSG